MAPYRTAASVSRHHNEHEEHLNSAFLIVLRAFRLVEVGQGTYTVPMAGKAALIGFGEAGRAFAEDTPWPAFDIDPTRTRTAGLAEVLTGAEAILSLVTADAAINAAAAAVPHIARAALFFDMNSVSPDGKKQAARYIEAAGGCYVDVAVMAPVHPERRATPLLLSGPHAKAGLKALSALGFTNARIVGNDVGRASTIKMLRSVMYKGVEALTAECLLACEKAGVTEEVLASFGNDWATGADYRLDRMMVHGERRAAEMAEVVKTLEALGIDAVMTHGTVERQAAIGALHIKRPPAGLGAKLERLSNA
jgi:3-hydroxyisobutyrate dehydrogenase-like beta-hydroxyacid dehydrogenase